MKNIILILTIGFSLTTQAQKAPLRAILEHFTNTKCSVCASRNPGLLTNKNQFPSLDYISIHPSAPYSSCPLSQQNKTVNDTRTNFYGVYGSTPRIVINGSVIGSGSDYADSNLFKPYLNQMTSFDIKMKINRTKEDSMTYQLTIYKVDTSSITNASLFSGNIEDTVFVNGGNGEARHYNVLRYGIQENISLPTMLNDSVVISKSVKLNSVWDEKRISSFSILQTIDSKQFIQTGKTGLLLKFVPSSSSINSKSSSFFSIYPNPCSDILTIDTGIKKRGKKVQIYDLNGKELISTSQLQINLNSLSNGFYYIQFEDEIKRFEKK